MQTQRKDHGNRIDGNYFECVRTINAKLPSVICPSICKALHSDRYFLTERRSDLGQVFTHMFGPYFRESIDFLFMMI